jgi:hypothetical protein
MDLRADEQHAQRPDHSLPILPISSLGHDPFLEWPPPHTKVSGILSEVDGTAWHDWREEVFPPDPVCRLRPIELVVRANVYLEEHARSVSVLVDTGSRVPILFRKSLFPSHCLEKAVSPISLITADHAPMEGGIKGCSMIIALPVLCWSGEISKTLRCPPTWAFEAAIKSSDIILGYPFLRKYKLVVDCSVDSLRTIPLDPPRTPTSPRRTPTPPPTLVHPGRVPPPHTVSQPGGKSSPNVAPGSKMKAPEARTYVVPSSRPVRVPPRRPKSGRLVHSESPFRSPTPPRIFRFRNFCTLPSRFSAIGVGARPCAQRQHPQHCPQVSRLSAVWPLCWL